MFYLKIFQTETFTFNVFVTSQTRLMTKDIPMGLGTRLQFWQKINGQTSKFAWKVEFPRYTESVKFRSQSRETAQNENHTEDWALGSHPRGNGHVTH